VTPETSRASDAAEGGETHARAHIDQSVQPIARLHADHQKRATPLQQLVDRTTAVVGQPAFLGAVTAVVVIWIAGDLLLVKFAGRHLDSNGFPLLQGLGQLLAIYITALILMSQRRRDELSELRDQLSLEMAVMIEQKVAKLISLTEEMRRDNPQIADRVDPQASAMSLPADPEAVLAAFKEAHEGLMAEPAGLGEGDSIGAGATTD
jgi:uncharacterized membrane protein